ncbi:MAG: capsule assembly Wzi family protein [Treponemataceae bacterium]|nr:capsule assembly Wzi family protein [Treponemataceae bacterium]
MNKFARTAFLLAALFFAATTVSAQEALKSTEEEYYDFLALQGITFRPTLNYRTLSDSVWSIGTETKTVTDEDGNEQTVEEPLAHPWQHNNLGKMRMLWQPQELSKNGYLRGVPQGVFLKIYGPEWYNSFNTAAPYGQNDGALWQDKGYNTSLTAGARLEVYGLELTIKPQVSFSQNMAFDYIKPNYAGTDKDGNPTIFSGGAAEYGYYGVTSIDAPQRFGDKPFFTFDWGDTEVRYSWHTLTIGFGTQAIWLGPAQLNPIIHSNNAPSYPKFDIGLRKQAIVIPKVNWYLGDLELRCWWGKLSESDYFDTIDSNDSNLISGVSAAWSLPWIFKGLTIGINRTMLSKWDDISAYSLFEILIPGIGTSGRHDDSDQRFSFTIDYRVPKIGLELYFEWARNDFSPTLLHVLRYPFHTQGWTAGIRKTVRFSDSLRGEFLLECTNLESSRDYELFGRATTFYAHHIITQGHTNGGQWLGAGIGTGGNSQYIGFKLYYPKGYWNLFFQRNNPDLDYTWYYDKPLLADGTDTEKSIRVKLSLGTDALYFLTENLTISGGIVSCYEMNPLNDMEASPNKRLNFLIHATVKYMF